MVYVSEAGDLRRWVMQWVEPMWNRPRLGLDTIQPVARLTSWHKVRI